MVGLAFRKYSVYGNTFVVVDELDGPILTEAEKANFALVATDPSGGIGADRLLVLQRCTREVLTRIDAYRGYWDGRIPVAADRSDVAEIVFRSFEPDGTESLCSGNGLLCAAMHMAEQHGQLSCRALTELPSPAPRVRLIRSLEADTNFNYEAVIGRASEVPASQILPSAFSCIDGPVGGLVGLDLVPTHGLTHPLTLHAMATFTGEPHLVVCDAADLDEAAQEVYLRLMGPPVRAGESEPPRPVDVALLESIGRALNEQHRTLFPRGINLSFARVCAQTGQIEYRSFERGLMRETLACGTAAVAIGAVLRQLGAVSHDRLTLLPRRSRGNPFYADSKIQVVRDADDSWSLQGSAKCIFEATIRTSQIQPVSAHTPSVLI